jgi:hypothetical protein
MLGNEKIPLLKKTINKQVKLIDRNSQLHIDTIFAN